MNELQMAQSSILRQENRHLIQTIERLQSQIHVSQTSEHEEAEDPEIQRLNYSVSELQEENKKLTRVIIDQNQHILALQKQRQDNSELLNLREAFELREKILKGQIAILEEQNVALQREMQEYIQNNPIFAQNKRLAQTTEGEKPNAEQDGGREHPDVRSCSPRTLQPPAQTDSGQAQEEVNELSDEHTHEQLSQPEDAIAGIDVAETLQESIHNTEQQEPNMEEQAGEKSETQETNNNDSAKETEDKEPEERGEAQGQLAPSADDDMFIPSKKEDDLDMF